MTDPRRNDRRGLDRHLEPALDEESVARIWKRVREREAPVRAASRTRVVVGVSAGLALAAAAVLAVWSARPHDAALATVEGDLVVAPGAELLASDRDQTIALDDGSRVELAQAAELVVVTNDAHHFITALRRGRAHFAVEPGGPRRWEIETDLATVEVVGTEFTVTRDARGVSVTVDHGIVLVRGERVESRIRRLTAGQRLDVAEPAANEAPTTEPTATTDLPTTASGAAAVPTITPTTETDTAPAITAAMPTSGAPSAPTSPTEGTEQAPTTVVSPTTTATPTTGSTHVTPTTDTPWTSTSSTPAPARTPRLSIEQALAAADREVSAGRPAAAADLLERTIASSPRDARVGVAAYQLGRIALDQLDAPARAADAFRIVIRRGRPRALLDDARVHRIEALARSGQRDRAQDELDRWSDADPGAPGLDEARAFLR